MRSASFLAPLFFAATSFSQAVEEGIAPSSPPPAGCQRNADGNFTIGTLKVGHKLRRETAAEAAADGALTCTLTDGILRDRDQRTGSVVANHQFQFDGPPQAGAIYTGGFSICSNGSLAIGGSTRWWQCSSGGFYNLYDEWIGAQCEEIRIQVTFPNKPSLSSAAQVASSSVPVASVASSLATISGPVSTVSKSAIGPSASFTANSSATSGVLSRASSAAGTATRSLTSGASSATGATSAAPAPPAGGAAVSSFVSSQSSLFATFFVVLGAAVML